MSARTPICWDMETSDPDDFLTLLLLAGHPAVDLRSVTVTPGGADQLAVVRWGLAALGREDVPVGSFHDPDALARNDQKQKGRAISRVSGWHNRAYGMPKDGQGAPDALGWEVLRDALGPEVRLVTGAALKNLGRLLREGGEAPLGQLFAQGGFAGEGVIPPERQLEKFKGLRTCPTFNLNGDPKSALAASVSPRFSDRRFISKNVCHGVYYDQAMHARVQARIPELPDDRHRRSLELIAKGMGEYLRRRPDGKKFHDPLAACCAIAPDVGEWAEVEIFRERGQWGAQLAEGSGTRIITDYHPERFVEVLLGGR